MLKILNDRLKLLREESGLSQSELDRILELAPTTISSWELYKSAPCHEHVLRLSNMYNVSVDYLYGKASQKDPVKLQETIMKYRGKEIKILHAVNETGLSEEVILKLLGEIAQLRRKD